MRSWSEQLAADPKKKPRRPGATSLASLIASKLSVAEDPNRARQRNRSLKKSAAVDDDPSMLDTRRAASFDASQINHNSMKTTMLRPGSFDVAASSRVSAFSPVEVPRLLIHSPASPLNVERQLTPDNRLLTVPSPDFQRKSPLDPRLFGNESPKAGVSDYMASMNSISLNQGLLSAMVSSLSQAMDTSDPPKSSIMQMDHYRHSMDCSGSLETLASASLDLAMAGPSGLNHDGSLQPSASADLLASMPPKSLIQDDIRSSQSRFQLVRKRGRSEVWNLFGQVLDTATNHRLPYVACYACKVLYTDTGGGTGNMTRHRCPIGMSYRSSAHGSSTETVEAGQMSSFESQVSVMNRTNEHKPNPLGLSMTAISDEKPSNEGHEIPGRYYLQNWCNEQKSISLGVSNETGSSMLVSQNSGEVSIGDMDRDVLTDSLVRCCAQDMLDPTVFNGRGFKVLFEKIWQLSKRTAALPHEVFPDTQMISSSLQTNLRFCTDDLKNELSRTSQGVCLTLESLSYGGRDFKVVHCSRISHDWKWRSNILGVFKARENQSLNEIINLVIHNYELDRSLLRITCSRNSEEFAPTKTYLDIKEKLREIILAVLTNTTPSMSMLNSVKAIVKKMYDSEIRLPFEYRPVSDDIFHTHQLLTDWFDHLPSIEGIIKSKCPMLLDRFNEINSADLRDIGTFLDPFRETIDSLLEERPNFHKVLPEWYALMHECQPAEDEPSRVLRELKQKAMELLAREKANVITVEHRIAAILNPRLNKKLTRIFTESERQEACDAIRATCGIRSQREPLSRGSSTDGEPHRKRRMFLSALEEDTISDDELECYLRSQFPSLQTKDVFSFWGTAGQSQFPSLAALARRILSVPATAPKTDFDPKIASVAPDQLHTFLMLRSMFETERDE